MADERETGRALGISVNAQVDQGRQIVFQTHVDADTTPEQLDELLDKLNVACDRQAAFYELPQLRKAIRVEEDRLHTMESNFNDMEHRRSLVDQANTGQRRNVKLTAQEEIAKVNAIDQMKRQKEIVAEVKTTLAETVKRAGERHGAASTANS